MKSPPTLLSGQFSLVTAAKGIMKNMILGRSYKHFCNTHFGTEINPYLWFFEVFSTIKTTF